MIYFVFLFLYLIFGGTAFAIDVPYAYVTNEFDHKKCEGKASTFKVIVHRYRSNKLMSGYAIYSYKCNNGKSIDGPGFEKPFTTRLDSLETNLPTKNLLSPIVFPDNLKENDESLHNYLLIKSELQAAEKQIVDCDEYFQSKRNLLDVASETTDLAKESFDQGNNHEADIALSISKGLLDLALNFTPGVSWGRDLYEAFTGTDLLSGEDLDTLGRSIAIIGALTGGIGTKFSKGLKFVSKLMKGENAVESVRKSEILINSAAKNVPMRWGSWNDLQKVKVGSKEYAEVGNLLYKQHAIERMAPYGLIQQGKTIYSRGIPPIVVEHTVKFGTKNPGQYANTVEHVFENVTVISDGTHKIIHTVINKGH